MKTVIETQSTKNNQNQHLCESSSHEKVLFEKEQYDRLYKQKSLDRLNAEIQLIVNLQNDMTNLSKSNVNKDLDYLEYFKPQFSKVAIVQFLEGIDYNGLFSFLEGVKEDYLKSIEDINQGEMVFI